MKLENKMKKIDISILEMWLFVGVCNIIVCASGQEARWFNYWVCYIMSVVCLIKNVI